MGQGTRLRVAGDTDWLAHGTCFAGPADYRVETPRCQDRGHRYLSVDVSVTASAPA